MYFTKLKNKTLFPCEDQHFLKNFPSVFSFIKRDNFIAGKTNPKKKKKSPKKSQNRKKKNHRQK
jgi:hypothetical protein